MHTGNWCIQEHFSICGTSLRSKPSYTGNPYKSLHQETSSNARKELDYESCSSLLYLRFSVIQHFEDGDEDSKTSWSRWTRTWWSCALGHISSNTKKMKENCTKMYTRRMDWIYSWKQQQDEIRILFELKKRIFIYYRATQGNTGGVTIKLELMSHVLIPKNWKGFYLPQSSAYNQHSITKTGLVARGKESKEGRQTVFVTPLDPFGSDTHEEEESSEDYSQPRKVHCHSRWRNDQNAVHWVNLSRAGSWIIILANKLKRHLSCINQCQISASRELSAISEIESCPKGFWHQGLDQE